MSNDGSPQRDAQKLSAFLSDAERASNPVRFYDFDGFRIDTKRHLLMRGGEPIGIKPKALDLLLLLVRHPGRLLRKEELMNRLWPDTVVEEANLTQNVFVVRKALGEAPGEQRFIATVARQGYRFVGNVREVTEEVPLSRDDAIPGVARAESPRVPGNDDVGRSAEGSAVAHATSDDQRSALFRFRALNRLQAARWLGLLVVAVVVAGISVAIYLARADRSLSLRPVPVTNLPGMEPAIAASAETGANRVAVAPFENRTGDVSMEPLGQLATERTIRAIAGVSGVLVVPRPILVATGTTRESAALVSGGGASLVVTGTYYVHEDELEFQARIVDAASGRVLHGTAPVTGVRSQPAGALQLLEQKLAGAIAIHFDDVFGGLRVVSHPPTLDAYREYRAGLETFASDYPRTLKHLERALQADAEFLLPLMIMYFAHANLDQPKRVETALARMEGQWDRLTPEERLLVEFLRADWDGRRLQALRLLQDLERLVPASLVVNYQLVLQSLRANRPRAAVDAYDRLNFNERTHRHSIGTWRHLFVQHALHLLGEDDRELQQAKLAEQYGPETLQFLESEARALAALGRVADVARVIDRCLASTAEPRPGGLPGQIMMATVLELRAHGYREESLKLAGRAIDWYRNRPPDEVASQVHRDGLAHALYAAERWEEAGPLFSALAAENPRRHDLHRASGFYRRPHREHGAGSSHFGRAGACSSPGTRLRHLPPRTHRRAAARARAGGRAVARRGRTGYALRTPFPRPP